MTKIIRCERGFVVQGVDDDDLYRNAAAHIDDAHPQIDPRPTRDQLLSLAEIVA